MHAHLCLAFALPLLRCLALASQGAAAPALAGSPLHAGTSALLLCFTRLLPLLCAPLLLIGPTQVTRTAALLLLHRFCLAVLLLLLLCAAPHCCTPGLLVMDAHFLLAAPNRFLLGCAR